LTLLITRLVTSVTLFVAAIWLYRCGPTVGEISRSLGGIKSSDDGAENIYVKEVVAEFSLRVEFLGEGDECGEFFVSAIVIGQAEW